MDIESKAGRRASRGGARLRVRAAHWIPGMVACSTLALLAWSAWPTLRPLPTVEVAQAVFERGEAEAAPAADEPEGGRGAGGRTVQAAGWLEPEPYPIACTALADGVVATIEALEGERVEEGEVVARLVDEDAQLRLRRAEAELSAARAELAAAEADLAAARTRWDEPVELDQAVGVGRAALAESRAELALLPSQVEAARATLLRLDEELKRAEESRARGAATEFEVIVARQLAAAQRAEVGALEGRAPLLEARVRRLEAQLRGAERNLELRIEDRRALESAAAAVERARAAAERLSAQRDEAALELERMVIRAPISGYVQRRLKSPGDKVVRMMDDPASAQLVRLYDPEKLQVRVDVPLADSAFVFAGQRCEVVVEALPDTPFEGVVLRTTHEADLQKNTLQVKVRVIDPSPLLRPEMLTRVKFLPGGGVGAGARPSGGAQRVLAPESALDRRGGGARVWTVVDRRAGRGTLRAVDVEALASEGGWVAISGDVRPGALLALGAEGLSEGRRVAIAPSGGAP